MGHHIIFDRDENKLGHLIPETAHHIEIVDLDGEHSLIAEYPTNAEDSQFIVEGNFIAVEDIDHHWQLFEIAKINTIANAAGEVKRLYGEHIYYELGTYPVITQNFTSVTPELALDIILAGTRWEIGDIEVSGERSFFVEEVNPLEALIRASVAYGGELRFRSEISESNTIDLYVDLLMRRGALTGKRFEFGEDVHEINMDVDMRPVVTAIFGRGIGLNADPDTGEVDRIEFTDEEWRVLDSDPADKPAGQDWVGDEDARVLYGKPDGPGYALQFAGSPDAVDLGNPTAHQFSGSFSIEATVILDTTDNATIFRKGITGAGTMFLACDGGSVFFGFFHSSGNFTQLQGPSLTLGRLYNIAGSFNNTTGRMRVVVRDVDDDTTDFTETIVLTTRPANTANVSYIGKRGDDIRFFVGTIDEVRLWATERTMAQITSNFGREIAAREPELRGYYRLNEGSGTQVQDSSIYLNHGVFAAGAAPVWVSGFIPVRRHIFGLYESQAQDSATLLEETWQTLQTRNVPRINIQARVADLEHIPGFEHETLRLGDTVYLIARRFQPPIQAAARVIRIERDMHDHSNTRLELGNFRQTSSEDLLAQLEESRRTLEARLAIIERGEFFEFVGDPEFEYKLELGDRNIRIFGSTFFYLDGSGIFAINPLDFQHYWRFDNEGLRLTRDGGATFVHEFGLDHIYIGTDATFAGELDAVTGTFESLVAGTAGSARMEFFVDGSNFPLFHMYDANYLRISVQTDKITFEDEGLLIGTISGVVATPGLPASGEFRIFGETTLRIGITTDEIRFIPAVGIDFQTTAAFFGGDVRVGAGELFSSNLVVENNSFLSHVKLRRSGVPQLDITPTSSFLGGFAFTMEGGGEPQQSRLFYGKHSTGYGLIPTISGGIDLGLSTNRFRNVYANAFFESGARIVSSFSNANGRAIAFSDGTQICVAQFSTVTTSNVFDAAVSHYWNSFTWTYPAAFAAVPAIFTDSVDISGITWGGGVRTVSFAPTASQAELRLLGWSSTSQGQLQVMAIGRWFN